MLPEALRQHMFNAAVAFRGYNVTNLGRTGELLAHPLYGPVMELHLRETSQACEEILQRPVDLVGQVQRQEETTLETYPEAVALVVSASLAQLRMLEQFFGIAYRHAKLSFGYSLGEITAVVASGLIPPREALRVVVSLASDCADLAHDVTLAVLFSRSAALPLESVERLATEINAEGKGIVGISGVLSPNSVILLGQGDTLDRFEARMGTALPVRTHLRRNPHRAWPPMHTPIVWQRSIPDRAAVLMQTLPMINQMPQPPVLSLVTGKASYNDYNVRQILHRWVDEPQQLWAAVYEILASNIDLVVHVGPAPNIVPATFKRLRDNVQFEIERNISLRALSAALRRPWLRTFFPQRVALLRALHVDQLVLEDWLLDHAPA